MTRPGRATDVVEQAFEQIAAPDHEHDSAWVVRGEETGAPSDPVVFHVHPTTASGARSGSPSGAEAPTWFADPADPAVAAGVDAVVAAQTSPFRGRLWSPRYRQATTRAFHERAAGGESAYDRAYDDVAAAFAQFLVDDLRARGPVRPVVLVGHSQGARHVRRLLTEFFDHDGLADRLVAAYVVGTDLAADDPVLASFPLATTPEQTGVVVAYQARLATTAVPAVVGGAAPACVEPAALGLGVPGLGVPGLVVPGVGEEHCQVTRVGGHLCLPSSVDLAGRALADGRLHHVEIEVLADVLDADVRRRTAAWHARRAGAPAARDEGARATRSSADGEGDVPSWPGVRGRRVFPAAPTDGTGAGWHVVDLPGPSGARETLPLVLLHKLGGWAADWREVAAELSAGRRVVVVDLPGHGGSSRPGPTPWAVWPADTAAQLAGVLDELDVPRAHLMGCSLGGVVALHLAHASAHRVESLTLLGTSLTARFTAARTAQVDRLVRPGFAPGWVPRPGQNARAGTGDPRVLAEQDASRACAGRWVRPSERGVGLAGVEHLIGEVGVPTLYLNGEHAGYRSYEEVARRAFARGEVDVVDGCGSFPHQERPSAVAARWRDFAGRTRA